jgi:tetratricopeptide (TPR) repeat protein
MIRKSHGVSIASLFCTASIVVGCGESTPAPVVPSHDTATHTKIPTQIISPSTDGTAKELLDRGERALLAQRWREAADAFEALLAADPDGPRTSALLYDLAMAYEGLEEREKARDKYHELAKRFPDSPNARSALVRATALHAYLEEWKELGATGAELLARKDLDDVDRMTALGARGLSRIEAGEDGPASKDVQDGLDIVDQLHYGASGRLPIGAAQLRFALGEIRRVRSEKISFTPITPDFLTKIEMRCAGLLEAQSAFADAIRSVDPHWAAMSGFRIGEMYRALHHDLMTIPPQNAKTENDRQLFYGMMHVRYRVLLEKGLEMVRRTLELTSKTNDASPPTSRAQASKKEMELALEEEKAQIKKNPFTEEELAAALEVLKKKTLAKAAKPTPP